MIATFWYLAGVLSGATAALLLARLYRSSIGTFAEHRVRYLTSVVFITAFAVAAIIIYLKLGSPQLLSANQPAAPLNPTGKAAAGGATAKSMQVEIANLETRLNRDGGTADDWLLLARSYDFLGRSDDAQRAREKASATGSLPSAAEVSALMPTTVIAPTTATAATATTAATAPAVPPTEVSIDELQRRVKTNPRDVQAWLGLGEAHRRVHEYPQARAAYLKAISLKGMTAAAWADYADALASMSGGQLSGESARAIDNALALDGSNQKALWLKATEALQDRKFADALGLWKRLRTLLPADSTDARIIDANILEASQLAGVALTPAVAPTAVPTAAPTAAKETATGSGEVSGTVNIDSKLASRVVRGATLFIYAKAADSPGPPLAVMRTVAGSWPVSFHLDDSMAMMPTRRLSQFTKVVVEARVSRSGQATPATGDFYVTSDVLQPAAGRKLALVINREIG